MATTSQGHPRSVFKQALQHENLLVAEATAREIGKVGLVEALELTLLDARLPTRACARACPCRAEPPPAPTQPGSAERQKPRRQAGRKASQTAEARPAGAHQPAAAGAAEIGNLRGSGLRGDRSAGSRGRQTPPLELEPFSDEWLAWYAEHRLRSQIDLLNHNDALRGIVPPP